MNKQLGLFYSTGGEALIWPHIVKITRLVEKECSLLSSLGGSPLVRELTTEFTAAEQWYNTIFGKQPVPSELTTFWEQRYDGMDRASLSFVKLAQWMYPRHHIQIQDAVDECLIEVGGHSGFDVALNEQRDLNVVQGSSVVIAAATAQRGHQQQQTTRRVWKDCWRTDLHFIM